MPNANLEPDRDLLRELPSPETETLTDVTADVHADAAKEPETYLTDTLVPSGGE
jgi:hypothetical protein